ncbi:MAG: AAA family ATPase, partial [Acidimicrobiales bacterium]
MRVTRLHLHNYRVYEDPLDLQVPPGLVGIYGPNGSGKSVLLESVLWTLWGIARTNKDEVRTAGVGADCVSEVEFEHEGHLYLVRRTLSGVNATVRAEAHADGSQVAEGVRDTGRYVHSVLGMDDTAFRASVFAEQKQLAAFSLRRPAERRQLVLGLLGITPLDAARDQARRDAREQRERLDQLRTVLADLGRLEADQALALAAAIEADERAAEAGARADAAAGGLAAAEAEHQRLDQLGRAHAALVAEGRGRRAERDELAQRQARLRAEAGELEEAEVCLAALEAEAAGLAGLEGRLRVVESLVAAYQAVEEAMRGLPAEPAAPDHEGAEAAVEAAQSARAGLAELDGRRLAAAAERDRAMDAMSRSGELSGEGECPLCGQPLGCAFEAVQGHRRAELEVAESALAELETVRGLATKRAGVLAGAAERARAELATTVEARATWERAASRLADARDRLDAV